MNADAVQAITKALSQTKGTAVGLRLNPTDARKFSVCCTGLELEGLGQCLAVALDAAVPIGSFVVVTTSTSERSFGWPR